MSVIGTASVLVSAAAGPSPTLEDLAVAEFRRVVARRQVLERKLSVLQPELESVVEREKALKTVVGSSAAHDVTSADEIRKTVKEVNRWSYKDGTATYGVRVSYLEWLLDNDGYKVPETLVETPEASELLVDVVAYYGEVTIFWYMLRVLYDGKLDSFMDVYATKFGLSRADVVEDNV